MSKFQSIRTIRDTDNRLNTRCNYSPYDFKIRENRLNSFDDTNIPSLKKESLATSGFYYDDKENVVKCAYCKNILEEDGAPSCKFRHRRPAFPPYACVYNRTDSYKDFPKQMAHLSSKLADAGFFYSGKGDQVFCFWCGGGLEHLEFNDDPWEEHAKWYPNCKYLTILKDRNNGIFS